MTMENSTESPSRIPVTLRRTASLRQKGERSYYRTHHQELFPAITENAADADSSETPRRRPRPTPLRRSTSSLSLRGSGLAADEYGGACISDAESVKSYGSNCSNYSATSACEHAHFGLNGTTWSARSRRYVVHCSPQGQSDDGEQYLTPTQRAARQIRKFQALLKEARGELDDKDQQIARLTKELVELRLFKASLSSPEDKTDSSETALTVCEGACPQLVDKSASRLTSPLVDSGHFEDGSLHGTAAKDRERGQTQLSLEDGSEQQQQQQRSLVASCHFERRIDEMQRRHLDEVQLLKQAHHDKLEGLLNQLADTSTRYCEAQPALERAQARSRKLETEIDELRLQLRQNQALLDEQEERNKQAYLEMYAKGQQAARILDQQQQEQSTSEPNLPSQAKVSVAELLQQLTVTQAELENVKPFQDSCNAPEHLTLACCSQSLLSVQEAVSLWVLGTRKALYRRILESRNKQDGLDPEITLQFLKSAIYYFLTDRENLHGHLNAIESILGFTDTEKLNIDKIYRPTKK